MTKMITPHLLYTMGLLSLTAVVAVVMCWWVWRRLPRAWAAARQAQAAPAAVLAVTAALVWVVLTTKVSWPINPEWMSSPIRDGWDLYYAGVIGILGLAAGAAGVLTFVSACAGVFGVTTWLDSRDQPESSEISYQDQLRQLSRLWRGGMRRARLAFGQNPVVDVVAQRRSDAPASEIAERPS